MRRESSNCLVTVVSFSALYRIALEEREVVTRVTEPGLRNLVEIFLSESTTRASESLGLRDDHAQQRVPIVCLSVSNSEKRMPVVDDERAVCGLWVKEPPLKGCSAARSWVQKTDRIGLWQLLTEGLHRSIVHRPDLISGGCALAAQLICRDKRQTMYIAPDHSQSLFSFDRTIVLRRDAAELMIMLRTHQNAKHSTLRS